MFIFLLDFTVGHTQDEGPKLSSALCIIVPEKKKLGEVAAEGSSIECKKK